MKKMLMVVAIAITSFGLLFYSCKKEEIISNNLIEKNLSSQGLLNIPDSMLNVSFTESSLTDSVLANAFICESYHNFFQMLQNSSPSVLKALYADFPWLKGYVIQFNSQIEGWNEIAYIINNGNISETASLGYVLKWQGGYEDGLFTGNIIMEDFDGFKILENSYYGGIRTSEINNFQDWIDQEDANGCERPTGELYFRKCTKKQFSDLYHKAKNECEADWYCDFACSFNPCAIAFLGEAMRSCW